MNVVLTKSRQMFVSIELENLARLFFQRRTYSIQKFLPIRIKILSRWGNQMHIVIENVKEAREH